DDVPGAEALAGPIDAGQGLLRRDRPVEALDRLQAGVAVSARPVAGLAEVIEQHPAPAAGRLAVAEEGVELVALDSSLPLRRRRCLRELPQLHDVLEAVQHPGIGRQTVPARTAGLLIIGFEALRQVEVDDE